MVWPSGKMFGGASPINGLQYLRGHNAQFICGKAA
ncbi:hypothetical protein HCZ87_01515 [Phaeobacter sp. HF9A]|nr:hypothetical protein [Phaeobacter sp. HF9A]